MYSKGYAGQHYGTIREGCEECVYKLEGTMDREREGVVNQVYDT